jgi:wobble nucleotide-excising tRNase
MSTGPNLIFNDLVDLEENSILAKKVIGKEDVNISAMIQRLSNSDWVKSGIPFFKENKGDCPFCQQPAPRSLADDLNEFFDETYMNDIAAIDTMIANYDAYSQAVINQLEQILTIDSSMLNNEALTVKRDLLATKILANRQHIARKKAQPSQPVVLEGLEELLNEIQHELDVANGKIVEHNTTIDNISAAREALTNDIWRFIVEEAKVFLGPYQASAAAIKTTITNLMAAIRDRQAQLQAKNDEITELGKKITSIEPTIDAINKILSSFGFTGFALAKSEKAGFYKLQRSDGTAATNLSEGERTFVTFLYFYHRLKGGIEESSVTTSRVVVIDDPVSSLDGDVLFIVSNLIKDIFEKVRSNYQPSNPVTTPIKQCIVLTHNVYFHKEITFSAKRGNGEALNDETFWVVRKPPTGSAFQQFTTNPIRTSYELLWQELRGVNTSHISIQNTMRRIIENYFKIMGNISPDTEINKFEGAEKVICRSLMSWTNDGSHFASDDMYVHCDEETVERYKIVFKKLFENTNHLAHYNMMMRIVDPPESDAAAA